jgi:hypothetical protein
MGTVAHSEKVAYIVAFFTIFLGFPHFNFILSILACKRPTIHSSFQGFQELFIEH